MLSSPEGPGNGRALTEADDDDASGGSLQHFFDRGTFPVKKPLSLQAAQALDTLRRTILKGTASPHSCG